MAASPFHFDEIPKDDKHHVVMPRWQTQKLGDIAVISKGNGLSKADLLSDGAFECIHYGELFTDYGEEIHAVKSHTNLSGNLMKSKKGDILMPTSDVTPRGLATASCILRNNVILGGDILLIRPDATILDGRFFAYYVAANKQAVLRLTTGSTIFHLYGSDMRKLALKLPKLIEQQRIVTILEAWDTYAVALEHLIERKIQLKKSLMQQLLTGKSRLSGFSDQWTTVQLGQVATMRSGGTPNSKVTEYYGGDTVWVSIADMTAARKYINSSTKKLTASGLQNSSAALYPSGTVLYAMYASIGECVIATTQLSSSQAILGIQVSDKLSNEFLYYYLTYIKDKVKTLGQQGTQSNLNASIVRAFEINLPSVAEQEEIVRVLTTIDEQIAAYKTMQTKIQQQKKYLLKKLITGKIRTPENLTMPKEAISI